MLFAALSTGAVHAQGLIWAKRAGGNGYGIAQAIAVDNSGNSCVAGYFSNSVTFGPGEVNQTVLTSPTALASDMFVARYNSAGTLLWARRAGGNAADFGFAVGTDSSGNCYVGGSFDTSMPFPSGPTLTSAGGVDIFVAKYNSSGDLQWAKRAGGTGSTDEVRGLAIDGSGNVLITGYFMGSATFGPGEGGATVLASAGQHDIFVAKMNGGTGNLTWARRAGGTSADLGYGVSVDSSGNSYVAGSFQGTATFGAGEANVTALTSGGGEDVFVARYDVNGSLVWAKRAGGAGESAANGIGVDAAGNASVVGYYSGSALFGGGTPAAVTLTSLGQNDIFVARYNTAGGLLWARSAGGTDIDYGHAVSVDSAGASFVTGRFRGTATFGTGGSAVMRTSAGAEDVFVAKYDSAGVLVWVRRDGGTQAESGFGIGVQGSPNNISVAGHFSGNATFGSGELNQTTLNGTGFADVFVAKLTDTSGAAKVGVYNAGVWRLDSNNNGVPDDPLFNFNTAGATRVTGDWNGDGKDQIGLFVNGHWFLDYNGNGQWDGGAIDRQYLFGFAGVTPVVGDWTADGKDKIGIYVNGFWYLDMNGNGVYDGVVVDRQVEFGFAGVTPYVGDWNGDGRDKVGLYINGFWFTDFNGNYLWDGPVIDRTAEFGWNGVTPLIGDWNGDGRDTIGVFINGFWFLDYNGNYLWDGPATDRAYNFGYNGATPLIGDWNASGTDKIGIFDVSGLFYLDADGSGAWDGGTNDKVYFYGQVGDQPVIGVW